jgi:hypothetical protein
MHHAGSASRTAAPPPWPGAHGLRTKRGRTAGQGSLTKVPGAPAAPAAPAAPGAPAIPGAPTLPGAPVTPAACNGHSPSARARMAWPPERAAREGTWSAVDAAGAASADKSRCPSATSRPLNAHRSCGARGARRAHRPDLPVLSVRTRRAWWAHDSRRALRTLVTRRACWASRTLQPHVPLQARRAVDADGALWACEASRALGPPEAARTNNVLSRGASRPRIPGRALRSALSRRARLSRHMSVIGPQARWATLKHARRQAAMACAWAAQTLPGWVATHRPWSARPA